MADGYVNESLDQASYYSPVLVIGLYIAAGSLVCLLFMLFDILSSIRHRQPWIPCRLFSLNSITLTLLTISSKISVDLTTPMLSVHDQLSKLTATTFICISIGFLAPSVAKSGETEYISNIASLSIMVITVVVNVCIQIYTGVIHLFIPEYVIIMCCILVLPLSLWYGFSDLKSLNAEYEPIPKRIGGSIFQHLRVCYVYSFEHNVQLKSCIHIDYLTMAGWCLICLCVLIQAGFRSIVFKQLKFCGGNSDYDWSVWIIVTTQIMTVVVGFITITFRSFAACARVFNGRPFVVGGYEIPNSRILRARRLYVFLLHLRHYAGVLNCVTICLMTPIKIVIVGIGKYIYHGRKNIPVSDSVRKLKEELRQYYRHAENWEMQKVVNDIEKWKEESKRKPLKQLSQLISRIRPSPQFNSVELKSLVFDRKGHLESSLPLAVLVRIATFCMLCNLTRSLQQCFIDAYDIIHFIESRTKAYNRTKSEFTKALLIGDGFDIYLPQIISTVGKDSYHSLSPLNRAILILKNLPEILWISEHFIFFMARDISKSISLQQYDTVEEMCQYIEQMFIDMLHLYLSQFPKALFKAMIESSTDDFNVGARCFFKLLFSIEPMETQVEWSFPVGYNITSLIASQSHAHAPAFVPPPLMSQEDTLNARQWSSWQ